MTLEPVSVTRPAQKTEYTCPMHPEIVRDVPGSCPICGMALEPRIVSLAEEKNPELIEMTRRFWLSLMLSVPLRLIAMSEMLPGNPVERLVPMRAIVWIQRLGWGIAPCWLCLESMRRRSSPQQKNFGLMVKQLCS